MLQPNNQQIVARQVERIVRRLTSLSTLPSTAAGLLNRLNEDAFDPAALAESIQSDPALAARILMLASREGIEFTDGPSITEAVAKLAPSLLREAVISVKVFQLGQPDEQADEKRLLPRKQMAMHSLAVACCADELAQRVLPPHQRQIARLAGLLHDLGKCALDEVMPKSLEKMVEQARDERKSLLEIEQTHLGLDHSVLGRRLAQKWNLPEPIVAAIWLHHCDAQTLAADLPDVQVTRVIALADRLVRQWELGHSGSYDAPDGIDELAALLQLKPAQVQEAAMAVMEQVSEKSRALGLSGPDGTAEYYSVIRRTAAELVADNRALSRVQDHQQRFAKQLAVIEQFLSDVNDSSSAIELAQSFACAWQKHHESGITCVYIVADPTEPWVEAAAVDRRGEVSIQSHRLPNQFAPVPEILTRGTDAAPVAEAPQWVLEQTGWSFEARCTLMAPLKVGDKVVAVLIYENAGEAQDNDTVSCRIAACVIAMSLAVQKQYELSERFVQVMNSLRQTRTELARNQSLAGLAEMAAGAAHELNNPLAVISGRVQLLLASEEDETKKQMLLRIQGRTAEIAEIISDLMNFARPKEPEKHSVTVKELLAKTLELTRKSNGLNSIEAELAGEGLSSTVLVDVQQVTQSLSYILTNALQSYKGENGPVWIECRPQEQTVAMAIRDQGCGMDANTLAKAAEPFYSFKPAGRRRGMGLANAQRLLKLNGGSLKLDSQPEKGTTVTITLPQV
ncbi:MAG: HDOD domain-containing protein [Planctomycetaceae bacterium]|nr:HDOD domain-containing protein [Planctomycetaceae bacterium]